MTDRDRAPQFIRLRVRIGPEWAGFRLDQAVAGIWKDYSRSRLSEWIRAGRLVVDGQVCRPNRKLAGGEEVVLDAELQAHGDPQAEAIGLGVLYADDALLVINKPAGLVVHPGSGNRTGTLVNALLHFDPALAPLPRAGLVHRLDKDTSGCLLVARNLSSHHHLTQALKRREIHRHYQALVWGQVIAGTRIEAPIGRHPVDRRRQVVRIDGRPAVTHYRLARRLAGASLLDVSLETGRTHQIRVHLAHAGLPIVGDPLYGRRGAPAGLTEDQRLAWQRFGRQALHAARIEFQHPRSAQSIVVAAPLPADFAHLLEALDDRND